MPQTTDPAAATSDEAAESANETDATAPPADGADAEDSVTSTVPVTTLLEQEATIPFEGLTPDTASGYPAPVTPVGDRFDTADPLSFKAAI